MISQHIDLGQSFASVGALATGVFAINSNSVLHNSGPNAAERYRNHHLSGSSSLAQLQVPASKHYIIDSLDVACRVSYFKQTVVSKQYSTHGDVMPTAIPEV